MRISAVLLVKFLRNPQFCAIGNIFYSLEPFCSLELYEETVQLASYEFLLDFHIFQASLCTSKGIGNRVSCILAIFLYIAGVHSADMGLNPRIAEKKKAPCFTSPLMVGALLSRDCGALRPPPWHHHGLTIVYHVSRFTQVV